MFNSISDTVLNVPFQYNLADPMQCRLGRINL